MAAQRFWSVVDTTLVWFGGAVAVIAAIHVAADVTLKYLFTSPIEGTIVYVSNYYMVVLVFLPLACTELRNQHITVDLLPLRFGQAGNLLLNRCVWAFSALFYALLAAACWVDATRKLSVGEFVLDQNGQVYTWPSYFILPLGFGLCAAILVTKIFRPDLRAASPEKDYVADV